MIALRDLRPMLARLWYDKARVEALKREHRSLRAAVSDEVRKLVDSDDLVRELYHMRGELSTHDWERLRVVDRTLDFDGVAMADGSMDGSLTGIPMRRSESLPGLTSSP